MALRENLRAMRGALSPGAELMPVIKADAYGHGAVEVARRVAAEGVRWFIVTHLTEALTVRCTLPRAEILVVGAALPEEVPVLLRENVAAVIVDREHGRALAAAASS